jgi:hypothetical protein
MPGAVQIAQDAGPVQSITVELSAEDILTLDTIPVEVVPAPGEGKIIDVRSYFLQMKVGTNPFFDAGLVFEFDSGASVAYIADDDGILSALENSVRSNLPDWISATNAQIEDKALMFYADGPTVSDKGVILTSSLSNGGADYAPGDTGILNGGTIANATYEVDTVDGGGSVLTYHLTDPGDGYAVGDHTGAASGGQPGIGTGLSVNVLTVDTPPDGDGSLTLTIFYSIIDLQ